VEANTSVCQMGAKPSNSLWGKLSSPRPLANSQFDVLAFGTGLNHRIKAFHGGIAQGGQHADDGRLLLFELGGDVVHGAGGVDVS